MQSGASRATVDGGRGDENDASQAQAVRAPTMASTHDSDQEDVDTDLAVDPAVNDYGVDDSTQPHSSATEESVHASDAHEEGQPQSASVVMVNEPAAWAPLVCQVKSSAPSLLESLIV